jgi:hypothetical protein
VVDSHGCCLSKLSFKLKQDIIVVTYKVPVLVITDKTVVRHCLRRSSHDSAIACVRMCLGVVGRTRGVRNAIVYRASSINFFKI